jgi:hypothetical protein
VSWSWEVAERDHEIQDPTSTGRRCRVGAASRSPAGRLRREQHHARRDDYLRSQRSRLGWAIFVGRK